MILLQAPTAQSPVWATPVMMGLIVVIFYFFMIRPQMQRQKKEKQFREGLKKGDRVVTIGGVIGRVASVDEDGTILLDVDQNVKLRYEREAIRGAYNPASPAPAK